jgi:hypothetical protein
VLQRDRVDSVIEMLIKALFNTFNAFQSIPTQADIKQTSSGWQLPSNPSVIEQVLVILLGNGIQ